MRFFCLNCPQNFPEISLLDVFIFNPSICLSICLNMFESCGVFQLRVHSGIFWEDCSADKYYFRCWLKDPKGRPHVRSICESLQRLLGVSCVACKCEMKLCLMASLSSVHNFSDTFIKALSALINFWKVADVNL